MTDLFCTAPLCEPRTTPRQAAPGLQVCSLETDQFLDHLTEIPDLWGPFCDPDARFPVKGDGGRSAPGISLSAPVNLTVLAMHDPRTSWAEPGDLLNPRLALAEVVVRALQDSTGKHDPLGSYSVWESCRILGQHRLAFWALAQDWAGLMCQTVRLVRDQLAGLSGDRRDRRFSVHGCGGRLRPTLGGPRCDACGETVSGFALIELKGEVA